jgi:hypothetical protein
MTLVEPGRNSCRFDARKLSASHSPFSLAISHRCFRSAFATNHDPQLPMLSLGDAAPALAIAQHAVDEQLKQRQKSARSMRSALQLKLK